MAAQASADAAAAVLSSANIPALGAPLASIRTKLDGTGRESYDPNAVPNLTSLGLAFGLPAADFNYPFPSGRFIVGSKWANGPAAVEGARKDSSTWGYQQSVRSVVGDDTKLTPTTTNSAHAALPGNGGIALVSGDVGYFSCCAKASGYKFLSVNIENYDNIVVDVSTGVVVQGASGPLMTCTAKLLENGYCYVAVYYAANAAFTFNAYLGVNNNTGGPAGSSSYAGDGTSGILINTQSVSMQKCLTVAGVCAVSWRTGNSYDYRYDLQLVGGLTLYRRATGVPARWETWATVFDETALGAPVTIAKTRLIDRNDIRDYQPGISLFSTSGNAVDKFKAAAAAFTDDGEALSVLNVPRGLIYFGDTWLINKMGFKMRGAGRQHWGRPYGETTGGSAHPLMGTQITTVGAGVARRWSDVDGGSTGDAAKKPVIALGMPGIELRGFSVVTPRTGATANIWDNGIRLLGVDGCKLEEFNVYGGFAQAGIMLDATHSKLNAAMNALIDSYNLAPTRDSNLMSYGITDNLFADFEASGVSAIRLQGTTRNKGTAGQYDETTWLWSPNGCSDTRFRNFRLYQFGDTTARKAGGALIHLDYRVFTGGTPNNSGQNIGFDNGRLDGAGKWAIYLDNIDLVWFSRIFGETSNSWSTAQSQRNIIERTAACGPERLFSQCKMFFNYVSNGGAETTMANNYWDGRGLA
ncbi:hypothetical protein ASG03_10100 [Rhizobium sp. Leaf341]|nr:hypothetical protein ASG03_10100 [Rhizobium sp. Leaf341]